ncbi:crossover junction endonuclease EME1 isoform X1 [Leptinotarsa decemlineata]|uniref:crossover junction endonuclease EME1 isoform X1 n=1 Tax=Leptinotarsa decemlineata TaxID=7539 RepID=UPI003D306DB7
MEVRKERSKSDVEANLPKISGKHKSKQSHTTNKILKESQKVLKHSLNFQKVMKREDYIKNIVVNIDETVLLEKYGQEIKSHLESKGLVCRVTSSVSGLISWTRKLPNTIVSMFSNKTEIDEKQYFLIIPCKEFRKLVRERNLTPHVKFIHEIISFQHLCVAVFGMENPSEVEEEAVMDIEFSFKCFWQYVNKSEDLANWVMMATKSVAEIPHKLEQAEKYESQKQFFDSVNKDTVRIDKNGNGLNRLWRQILTVFPLVNLEIAEAICAVYPSPKALFDAYASSTEPEELLQDIPIRRAHGPLTSVRRVGPELSKKSTRSRTWC